MHIDATSRIYQHFDRYQNLHINQYIQIYHYEIIGDILIMIRIFYIKEKTKKPPKMAIIYININNSVAGTFSN